MSTSKLIAGDEWLVTCQSNVGECVMLIPPQQGVAGLRKPYQFEATARMASRIAKAIDSIEAFKDCQCGGASTKPTKYGMRLEVYVLAYAPGLVVPGEQGVTELEWNALVKRITDILNDGLVGGVKPYAEAWQSDRKFQFRFETYIKFVELN